MHQITERLGDLLSPLRLIEYMVENVLPNVVVAACIVLLFYLVWVVLRRTSRSALARTTLDGTARSFVITVLKYVVLVLGTISTLNQLGVNMASILTSMGVAGLTIGFAARDALSNVISGLFIFFS